ncbi:MAG: AI-2E family transporter [Sphaerochaeta sp.]|uniref:AI-2E family transporter n=1 Tax=Sphaerochaeta sp. TaxID=1972642 RepID=UPI002FC5A4CB
MAETQSSSTRYSQIFLGVLVSLAVLGALKLSKDVMIPLVLSFFCFLLFNPLLRRLDKFHIPKLISVTFVMALLLFIFVAAGWFVIMTADTLVRLIPFYAEKVASLDRLLSSRISTFVEIPAGTSFLSVLPVNWSSLAISSLTSVSNKFLSITKVAMLVYIFFLFLLLERQSVIPKLLAAVPKSKGMKIAVMFERITRQISKYLLLKAVISALTGVFFFLTAVVTGLDLPALWGVLAFIFNFIPSIGSVIITTLTILMALIQFAPDWTNVMYVAILTISTQMILGNIIDPRLQGGQLNLSPFVILVSLSLWGYIWGLPGMFISVPLTSVLQILCANIKSLRPIAILISSGKSYQRETTKQRALERYLRKQEKLKRGEHPSAQHMAEAEDAEATQDYHKGDFILPENFGDKK